MTPTIGTDNRDLLQQELAEIDLSLASAVCQDPQTWSLGMLRARTQAVIDASQLSEYRDRGNQLLAKIAQFEDVQRRHQQMIISKAAAIGGNSLTSTVPLTPSALPPLATPSGLASAPSTASANYNGSGWLMPVVTNKQGLPRFVLTDDNGNVLQFVTPQPGINLNRYVRQKIGIYGQPGYLPAFQRPHLMAERIVTLSAVR